jgi:hypothetical protein
MDRPCNVMPGCAAQELNVSDQYGIATPCCGPRSHGRAEAKCSLGVVSAHVPLDLQRMPLCWARHAVAVLAAHCTPRTTVPSTIAAGLLCWRQCNYTVWSQHS